MMIAMGHKQRGHLTEALAPRPKTNTELKRRNRALSLSDAQIAVVWLNATKGSEAYKRIVGLRAEMEYLGSMLNSIRRKEPVNLAEARLRHKKLTQELSIYPLRPSMPCDLETGTWRFAVVAEAAKEPIVEITDRRLKIPVSETDVVGALGRLAANRELFKARQCKQCRDVWLVAQREMDKFCSKQCREAFRQADEDSRERHARAQRAYIEGLKSNPNA